jgi:hypothetical protein
MTRLLLGCLPHHARWLLGLALWALVGLPAAAYWEDGLSTRERGAAPE